MILSKYIFKYTLYFVIYQLISKIVRIQFAGGKLFHCYRKSYTYDHYCLPYIERRMQLLPCAFTHVCVNRDKQSFILLIYQCFGIDKLNLLKLFDFGICCLRSLCTTTSSSKCEWLKLNNNNLLKTILYLVLRLFSLVLLDIC